MSSYDTLIIGGGLTGLILTHRLKQAGHNVHLIEARESLGGQFRRKNPTAPFSAPGVEFYPATNEAIALFEWLKQASPTPLRFEITEHRPQIFDEGRWKPFAGFGDVEFQSVSELGAFSHTHEIRLEPGIEQVVRILVEQLPIAATTMSEVTAIKVEDGQVTEVTVNGDKVVKASTVIFTPFPTMLNDLIAGDGLPAKHRTRLAKMDTWTAVALELHHKTPLAEDSNIRVFNHGSKEFEPVIGRIFGETSRWITLVPQERDSEHEFAGQNIRHIKRQLKRAWPEALEGPQEERIYVLPKAFKQHSLKTKEIYRFPEISNLYLASQTLASVPSTLGSLEVAKHLEELLVGSLNELPELGASC